MVDSDNGSDAWLLRNISCADDGDGADLVSVIRFGDYINRAVFLFDEFHQGVARLSQLGLVDFVDGGLRMTVNGRAFCDRHEQGGHHTCIDRLRVALQELADDQNVGRNQHAITKEQWVRACRDYRKST